MKFRTEIEISKFENQIDYSSKILCMGSCFAASIGRELQRVKFDCTINPTGVLFNPLSIASTIELYEECIEVKAEHFIESRGLFSHYAMHGSLSRESIHEATEAVNHAIESGHRALKSADWVILTLGTAMVYRLKSSGEVVANCHKQPSKLFSRERLSVDEITHSLNKILDGALRNKRVILTVSPIRHIADGLEQNSLSKALLRVAIDMVIKGRKDIFYFPSYEILMDDLRDYRYYGEDMVHPSNMAVEYIWQHFKGALLSEATLGQTQQIEKIIRATEHRPLHPNSDEFAAFCRSNIKLIDQIKYADLSRERSYFESEIGAFQ